MWRACLKGRDPRGEVAEWLKAADCKSARASVRWFESSPLHQRRRKIAPEPAITCEARRLRRRAGATSKSWLIWFSVNTVQFGPKFSPPCPGNPQKTGQVQ